MYANYLAEASDLEGLLAGLKWVRRIFQTEPLKSRILAEDFPGEACRTDDEIREFLHKAASTFCHPSGTCKMGQDAMAVVDDRLRVRTAARCEDHRPRRTQRVIVRIGDVRAGARFI